MDEAIGFFYACFIYACVSKAYVFEFTALKLMVCPRAAEG